MKYELNTLHNVDCMIGMRDFPDRFFELAIVDPPYGGGSFGTWKHKEPSQFGGTIDQSAIKVVKNGSSWKDKYGDKAKHWDIAPPPEYFAELYRVSMNQIIWGGNYFGLPPNRHFLIWRKLTISETFSMAMCEYAWSSFDDNAKVYEHVPQDKKRFHPTQKPVSLYKWILNKYAKPGDKILDTHAGSASSMIACYDLGFDCIGFELDEEYFNAAKKRLEDHKAQLRFDMGF